jgi:hypothetical protein
MMRGQLFEPAIHVGTRVTLDLPDWHSEYRPGPIPATVLRCLGCSESIEKDEIVDYLIKAEGSDRIFVVQSNWIVH